MQISKTTQSLIGSQRAAWLASYPRLRDAKPSRLYNEGESLVHQWNSKEREILGEKKEIDRKKAFPTELKEAIPLLVSYYEDQDQQRSEWSLLLE